MENEILILSGNANPELATSVVDCLSFSLLKGLKLGDMRLGRFADYEISVQIEETVRNKDVFVIQSTGRPANESWMELYCIIDALKRSSAKRITAVIPYYGYCRQDRKNEPRVPITAKLVANLLTTSGADRVLTLDLHAAQIQGFFDIPVDHMRAKYVFLNKIEELKDKQEIDMSNAIVVSPDVGGVSRARHIAKTIGLDIAIIDKRRERANEVEVMNVIGNVKGKHGILIDDIIDTAGTLIEASKALKEKGMEKIFIFATHGIFSQGKYEKNAYERINDSCIDKVYVTNSLKVDKDKLGKKIEVLSIASIIADAIMRIHSERSISELFDR